MAKDKKVTYTEEQTAALIDKYEAGRAEGKSNVEIIEALATETGRQKRSIISKLSRLGKYVSDPKGAKSSKDDGASKKEQFVILEKLGYSTEGLEGATKTALSNLIDYVQSTQEETDEISEDQAEVAA